ncbi:MAG: hypothetical protein R3A47_07440 [Polyangiales bacterium]
MRSVHEAIRKVTEDIGIAIQYILAIWSMMVLVNELTKLDGVPASACGSLDASSPCILLRPPIGEKELCGRSRKRAKRSARSLAHL